MGYKSKFTGDQVDHATKIGMHPNAGTVITYKSVDEFPPIEDPGNLPYEKRHEYLKSPYFIDLSTNIMFVDASTNSIYKWEVHSANTGAYIRCTGKSTVKWEYLPEPNEN